ncbi:hypothetical protein NN561_019750 [Cricetulus griseus]
MACARALGAGSKRKDWRGHGKAAERGGWDRGVPLTRYCHPPAASDRKQARTGFRGERTGARLRARRRFALFLAAPPSARGTFQDGRPPPGGRSAPESTPPRRYPCGSVRRVSSRRPLGLTQWFEPC